jgi:hypothetical protein
VQHLTLTHSFLHATAVTQNVMTELCRQGFGLAPSIFLCLFLALFALLVCKEEL